MRLRITRYRRVPHTLAVFGALLLTASLLAGGQKAAAPVTPAALAKQATETVQPANATEEGMAAQAVKSSRKKFRVKLFLFRR